MKVKAQKKKRIWKLILDLIYVFVQPFTEVVYLNRNFVPYVASYGIGAMAILSLKEGMEKRSLK